MNKQTMLSGISRRLTELEGAYASACEGKSDTGSAYTRNSAAVARSRLKRDIQILLLMQEIVVGIRDNYEINDDDALEGYERLVSPSKAHK